MATPEHQGAGPIEGIYCRRRRPRQQLRQHWQAKEQGEEEEKPGTPSPAADAGRQMVTGGGRPWPGQPAPDNAADSDHPDLAGGTGEEEAGAGGAGHEGDTGGIRTEVAGHSPQGLGHHRHGHDLEAVQHAGGNGFAVAANAKGQQCQGNG